jgi:hypothetical protein
VKTFINIAWSATVIVGVIFFLMVMTRVPTFGYVVLSGGMILFFRNLWLALVGLFGMAELYAKIKKP